MTSFLELKNITKYVKGIAGAKQPVFDNLNMVINGDDGITSIFAPFGGGKTTLLKILSGLDNDYTGEILLNGKRIRHKFPYIPEKPSSFPWLNVSGNIRQVIDMRTQNAGQSNVDIKQLIDLVGLTSYENHFPFNESYGFRFRISLARALVVSSPMILVDDSFHLMDPETKSEISDIIKTVSEVEKTKFIVASSDIADLVMFSSRILLINNKSGYLATEIEIEDYCKEWKR